MAVLLNQRWRYGMDKKLHPAKKFWNTAILLSSDIFP